MALAELDETIDMQLEALENGTVKAVLITPEEDMPDVPRGFRTVNTDVGMWIYHPLKLSANAIKKAVNKGTYHKLLGFVEPKSDSTDQIVVARENGVEAKSAMASKKNINKQKKELKKQFPKSDVTSGGAEEVMRVLMERAQ